MKLRVVKANQVATVKEVVDVGTSLAKLDQGSFKVYTQ